VRSPVPRIGRRARERIRERHKSADLSVDGYTVVGPAITFAPAAVPAATSTRPRSRTASTSSSPIRRRRCRPIATSSAGQKGNWAAHAGALVNVVVESAHGRVHFHAPDVATYQAAVKTTAGQKVDAPLHLPRRRRRLDGRLRLVGELLASSDRYDAIGVMGADPAGHDLHARHDPRLLLLGFCTAADGAGHGTMVGQLCPPRAELLATQGERLSTFESFLYEKGAGVGLTLRRSLYVRANRDLSHAMGNGVYYNPTRSTCRRACRLGAGDGAGGLLRAATVLKNSRQALQPDGKLDVITGSPRSRCRCRDVDGQEVRLHGSVSGNRRIELSEAVPSESCRRRRLMTSSLPSGL